MVVSSWNSEPSIIQHLRSQAVSPSDGIIVILLLKVLHFHFDILLKRIIYTNKCVIHLILLKRINSWSFGGEVKFAIIRHFWAKLQQILSFQNANENFRQ
jgi:hypothetical protein